MKKTLIFSFLILIISGVSMLYVFDETSAEKERKYYEEAGYIIWDIQTTEKVVALTFDDGPHPKYTEQVLDLLKQYGAKGTFFIVGQHAEKNPQVVLRTFEEGHEIANHTYTHPYTKSVSKIIQEIKQTNDTIYSITGYSPKLFRPVEGYYTEEIVKEVVKAGYKIVMWSWHQDTEDWKDPGVNVIVKKVLDGVGEGDNVLFHDGGGNREQTVKALEKILPELQKEGYKFITITEMIKLQEKVNKISND
ncbi:MULTISPECIES: polysaccharide deacetylase family protein [unclassified Lysinibacillus]|uniref:polysaccharide deacetylase family protein n=1 Tax=unclassified Lysinibacillus TaxID=2636778 RepID=UPI001F1113FB|nr:MULTISPECIES: polysaccharide deacetylase family protein [unclassified Lysinibacillus]